MTLGPASSVWNRYVAPTADDTSSRALRVRRLSLAQRHRRRGLVQFRRQYALRPDGVGGRRGVGLEFRLEPGLGELADAKLERRRLHELDVLPRVGALRPLGYGQSETLPTFGATPLVADSRRLRDGVNVGVGLRYDMNSSLGLRVEYARFGRFAGEIGSSLPETDQVSFGVQFRF